MAQHSSKACVIRAILAICLVVDDDDIEDDDDDDDVVNASSSIPSRIHFVLNGARVYDILMILRACKRALILWPGYVIAILISSQLPKTLPRKILLICAWISLFILGYDGLGHG